MFWAVRSGDVPRQIPPRLTANVRPHIELWQAAYKCAKGPNPVTRFILGGKDEQMT